MEELSVTDLRSTLACLLELATCPVCHETLTTKVVLCVRGHPVCTTCRQRLQKPECPLCTGAFSNVQPTWFTQQVIDALPHPCRHKDCDYFVKTKDDHEKYCIYKPTKCRYCDWSGPGKAIVRHLQSSHEATEKYLSILGRPQNGVPIDPKVARSVFTPIFVDAHFFWGEMKNEPTTGKLTAIFHPVPNGKTKTVFKGSVKLAPRDPYSAETTLNMDPDADVYKENSITIPVSKLDKCTENNKFLYIISVEQIYTLHSVTTTFFTSSISNIIRSKIELWNQRLNQ